MNFPRDYYWISAPGFSYSGSAIWPAGTEHFDNFWSACSAYEQAGEALYQSYLGGDWQSDGQTYEGESAPPTPPTEDAIGIAGAGQRNVFALIGNAGTTTIQVDFYDKKIAKEYRWVEDRAYVAPKLTKQSYTPFINTTCCIGEYEGSPTLNTLVQQLVGSLSDTYDSYDDLVADVIAGSSAYIGRTVPIDYNGQSMCDYRTIGGSYCSNVNPIYVGLKVWISGGTYLYGDSCTYERIGVQGKWHLEWRYVEGEGSDRGLSAYYFKTPFSLGDGNETLRDKFKTRLTYGRPVGEGNGTIKIGHICNRTTYVSSVDIWSYRVIANKITLPNGYVKKGRYHPPVEFEITLPGNIYVMQDGSATVGYNTLKGAFINDLASGKWSKFKGDYRVLVDFNGAGANATSQVPYTNQGVLAGVLKEDGKVYAFDSSPIEGFITYGKIGFFRLGFTHFLEARVDFRERGSGTVILEASMDGRNIDTTLQQTFTFTNSNTVRVYPNMRVRWANLKITGKYDLQYMEVRGNISGRR